MQLYFYSVDYIIMLVLYARVIEVNNISNKNNILSFFDLDINSLLMF